MARPKPRQARDSSIGGTVHLFAKKVVEIFHSISLQFLDFTIITKFFEHIILESVKLSFMV